MQEKILVVHDKEVKIRGGGNLCNSVHKKLDLIFFEGGGCYFFLVLIYLKSVLAPSPK